MPLGLQAAQLPKEDRHEIGETFADSLGQATFDGQSMRIELCVTRQAEPKPNQATEGKRYVTARIVLTPEAAIELFNVCTQMVGALKNAGVLKETPAPQAAAAMGSRN